MAVTSVLLEGFLLSWALLGAALVGAGVGLLWNAWRRRGSAYGWTWAGWLLLLAGLPAWVGAAGVDNGVAWWFATLAAGGLIWIALQRRLGPARAEGRNRVEDPGVGGLSLASTLPGVPPLLWRIVVAGPVAFAASLALGLLAYRFGPGADGDRLFLAATVVIFVWAALMIWASTARAPGMAGVGVLTLASLLTLGGLAL